MASDDKKNQARYARAREKGDEAGRKAKSVLAAIAAIALGIAAFGGQIFPFLAAGILQLIGFAGLAIGTVAVAVAMTIKKSSDEPKERMAWFFALVLAAAALLFYLGKL